MGFAVKTVVHAREGAVAQPIRRNCHVLEGQMVPERVVRQFHSGMVMIGRPFLARLQTLFGHRIHLVGIPPAGDRVSARYAGRGYWPSASTLSSLFVTLVAGSVRGWRDRATGWRTVGNLTPVAPITGQAPAVGP